LPTHATYSTYTESNIRQTGEFFMKLNWKVIVGGGVLILRNRRDGAELVYRKTRELTRRKADLS
jgi:hypothetical protein